MLNSTWDLASGAHVIGLVNQKLLLQNEYLAAENRILRAHLPARIRLSDNILSPQPSGSPLEGAAKSGPDLSRAVLAMYLPNLLGISGGLIGKKAREVFVDLPGTAAQVTQLLGSDANLPDREALLAWMREP